MAEKASWDQAKRRQKLGLVWRNRKKISQIIKGLLLLAVLPLNYFMGFSHVRYSLAVLVEISCLKLKDRRGNICLCVRVRVLRYSLCIHTIV
jgi:hypothetical protein